MRVAPELFNALFILKVLGPQVPIMKKTTTCVLDPHSIESD